MKPTPAFINHYLENEPHYESAHFIQQMYSFKHRAVGGRV
jgi:hypothetical protein